MPATSGGAPTSHTIPPPTQFFAGVGPAAGPETPQVLANRQMAKGAFPMRVIAFLVDGVIVGIIASIIGQLWVSVGFWGGPFFWITNLLLYALYKMFLEGNGGQTVGKMLFSLKVVRDDGQPMTMQQAQWRAIGAFLYVLIIPAILDFIWAAEVGMTLGDRWAHTAVIRVQ